MQPGQHGYLSMFKITLGCCITSGLDSATLEQPFPGLKPNSLDISQGTCREDLGFREVRTYFTCFQRRRCNAYGTDLLTPKMPEGRERVFSFSCLRDPALLVFIAFATI